MCLNGLFTVHGITPKARQKKFKSPNIEAFPYVFPVTIHTGLKPDGSESIPDLCPSARFGQTGFCLWRRIAITKIEVRRHILDVLT
jgi:hypothetical protein